MAVTSGYFNSVNDDRPYNAEQMTLYFEGLISNGIYETIGDKFQVTASEGMTVNVGTGRAMIKSHWIKNDSSLSLSIDAASTQYNRMDAIVLRYDASAREIGIVVKKGTETSGMPNAPDITRNNDVYELWLATIRVMKNTTTITQAMITDFRMSALCGYVTGLIQQVDTSTLFAQWQAAYEAYYAQATAAFDAYMAAREDDFNTWFTSLTQELRVDTTLHQFYNSVSVGGTTSEIMIGINDYDSNADLLLAFSNGVYLVGGIDYTITGTGAAAKINLQKPLVGANLVNFVVIKSVIGESSGGFTVGQAQGIANAFVGIQGIAEREDI
jgi:hypothetical protein